MVFHDTVRQNISDPNYENETWRARHHFKEAHQHAPPYRRNRDFKPVNYGSYRGILNFKHSEPWAILKNLRDLGHEEHNKGVKYMKAIVTGGFMGTVLGYMWFMLKPL